MASHNPSPLVLRSRGLMGFGWRRLEGSGGATAPVPQPRCRGEGLPCPPSLAYPLAESGHSTSTRSAVTLPSTSRWPSARTSVAALRLPVTTVNAVRRSTVTVPPTSTSRTSRSEEHTSELQSPCNLVCRLLLEKKKKKVIAIAINNQNT